MDANVKSRKKRRMTNPSDPSSPSLLSLPNDIVVNCLARVSRSYYRSLYLVSKSFHSILSSPEMYLVRSQIGTTEPCLYICLKLPSHHHRWFTLDTNGGESKDELTLVPLTTSLSASPAPSKSTTVAVGSQIYQISKRSSTVRVLDCLSHTWRRAPNMAVVRDLAKSIFFLDGKIYVLGGCRSRNEPMKWGEVLDPKTQTWKPFSSPTENALNPNRKVQVMRGRLYTNTRYAYDPKEGRWEVPPKLGFGFGSCFDTNPTPWCVIENVLFDDRHNKYRWWGDSSRGIVQGLSDLYLKRARYYETIQLVDYGGKLVILWHERVAPAAPVEMMRVWCAVIRLEKRISNVKPEIWGEIERLNVICTVPNSYELLSCLSVWV